MLIVIIEDRRAPRESIVRALPGAELTVVAPPDRQGALAAVAQTPPDVVMVGWPSTGGAELVQRARAADRTGKAYLLAVLDGLDPAREITGCLAAGVHDFIRRPLLAQDVLGRVMTPHRLLPWRIANPPPGTIQAASGFDFKQIRAWNGMGTIVATDLERMFREPLRVADGWSERTGGKTVGGVISMALAAERLEVRVSVGMADATLGRLGAALLGDPAAKKDELDDVLREMANIAGGAIKRAAMPDDVILTMGIPASEPLREPTGDARCWTASTGGGEEIAIVGELIRRENIRLETARLREGMVVAKDLHNRSGALLVRTGTRLTGATIDRVVGMLGDAHVVEVAHALFGGTPEADGSRLASPGAP